MLSKSREGATAVLVLDYPERRNALAMPMRRRLVDALEGIKADQAPRAIVITGAGEIFSAGGDISGMDVGDLAAGWERLRLTRRLEHFPAECQHSAGCSARENNELERRPARSGAKSALVRLLIKGSKPVIAAVEGWCVGAGLSVAMCS